MSQASKYLFLVFWSAVFLVGVTPGSVRACDGPCCAYPRADFRFVGALTDRLVFCASLPTCEPAPKTNADSALQLRRIRRGDYVVEISLDAGPQVRMHEVEAAPVYSDAEILYWVGQKSGLAFRTLQEAYKPAKQFAGFPPDLVRNALVRRNAIVRAVFGSDSWPFVVAIVESTGASANFPYDQEELLLFLRPEKAHVRVFNATSTEEAGRAADAVVASLQESAFARISAREPTGKHRESRVLVRRAEAHPYFADGMTPPSPAAFYTDAVFGRLVQSFLRAGGVTVSKDLAQYVDQLPIRELTWTETADVVLILADDLPSLLASLRSLAKEQLGTVR